MRVILFILLFFSVSAQAANYYFSSYHGDDSRSASEAQQQTTPWTVNRLIDIYDGSFSGSFGSGDVFSIETGSQYYGALNFTALKTLAITTNSYTTSASASTQKPLFHTLQTVTGWTQVKQNVWRATFNHTGRLQTVVINGKARAMGQWPNADSSSDYGGYRVITRGDNSVGPFTYLHDRTLSFSRRPQDLRNAELVIKGNNTNIDVAAVTSIVNDTIINFGAPVTEGNGGVLKVNGGYGYFFRGALSTLDRQYEWYWDKDNNYLYVYSFSAPGVQVSTIANGLVLSGQSNKTFDGIAFNASASDLANISGSGTNNSFNSCSFSNAGGDGISIGSNQTHATINNCCITDIFNNGVTLSGNYGTLQNSLIYNIGMSPGMGKHNNGNYCGVNARADQSLIVSANTIDYIGQHGITWNGNNTQILSNDVAHFCGVFGDAGGIYSSNGSGVYKAWANRRTVAYNYIHDGLSTSRFGGNYKNRANAAAVSGLYLDENVTRVDVIGNLIKDIPNASVYFHWAHNIGLTNNIFISNHNGYVPIWIKEGPYRTDSIKMSNNLFANIDLAGNSAYTIVYIEEGGSLSLPAMRYAKVPADVDNNKFWIPLKTTSSAYFQIGQGNGTKSSYSLSAWRTAMNMDYNSGIVTNMLPDTGSINYKALINTSSNNKSFFLDNKVWISISGDPAQNGLTYNTNYITLLPGGSVVLVAAPGSVVAGPIPDPLDPPIIPPASEQVPVIPIRTKYIIVP